MIIGLTGSYGAGKDTVANYLVERGFAYHSLSDLLRDELRARGQEITRENLIAIGNEIREKFGAGELARRTLKIIEKNQEKDSLVVSIRNPREVEVLRLRKDFQLWFVDAPNRIRYERTVRRSRSDDFQSYEEFVEKERQENSTDPNAQQLTKVAAMADATIDNDADFQSLYANIDKLLSNREFGDAG